MNISIKYIVCGITVDGHGWTDSQSFLYPQDATAHAEDWAKHESQVWVEKVTTYHEIIHSVSSALPQKEAMPI